MKKLFIIFFVLSFIMIILSCSNRHQSPYITGIVVKKEYVMAHFENQRPVVIEQANMLSFLTFQKGSRSTSSSRSTTSHSRSNSSQHYSSSRSTTPNTKSYSSSRSTTPNTKSYSSSRSTTPTTKNYSSSRSTIRSYKSISASRPSYVKPFTPSFTPSSRSTYSGNRSNLIYAASSGRYYVPVMNYNNYWDYQYCYNRSTGYLLLTYILIYRNMNDEYETPIRYYLPEYKLCVKDSLNYIECVKVDSTTFNRYHKGDHVNFPRFKTVEYENEW